MDSRSNLETQLEMATGLKRATVTRTGGGPEPAASGPASTASYVGYSIDNRYKIEELIGRGGMGVVYRARHQVIDKLVAVKILQPTADPDVSARFVNEARAASSIGNAHIVDTVDFGQLPDGSTYFVMEYLVGSTLASVLKKKKFLPIEHCSSIAQQIAEGIGAAHDAGIVHRDLKPENIFITNGDKGNDFVKLLDFGIAKMAGAQNKLTRAGTIFGTPHYMSPEQAAGAEVDRRTDIYSLGIIMYEMACGRVPFEAENPMGLLTQHMYTQPTPLTELESPPQPVPVGYDAVVLKCLAKKADDRYEDIAEVAADLERLDRGAAPAAIVDLLRRSNDKEHKTLINAARAAARGKPRSRRRKFILAALAIGSVAVAGAVGVSLQPYAEGLDLEGTLDPLASASSPSAEMDYTAAGQSSDVKRRPVSLVFSPIDARVYDGQKDLGGMPVTIWVDPRHPKEVEVRREGFYPERVKLDGSKRVVTVYLRRIPGVEPAVPVPDAAVLSEFSSGRDAAGSPLVDFGATEIVDAGARRTRADAGATTAPAPAPATPAPPSDEPGDQQPPSPSPEGEPGSNRDEDHQPEPGAPGSEPAPEDDTNKQDKTETETRPNAPAKPEPGPESPPDAPEPPVPNTGNPPPSEDPEGN